MAVRSMNERPPIFCAIGEISLSSAWVFVDGVCVDTTGTTLALENESHYHYFVKRFL
jgi:hypothetical protein